MADSIASAKRIAAAKRRIQALELRLEGKTFRAIGEAMGCSEQRAHRLVTTELARLNAKRATKVDELTRLEVERLDALWAAIWPKALKGEVRCVDRALAIAQRRARLLGLDAPKRQQLGNLNNEPFKIYGFDPEQV